MAEKKNKSKTKKIIYNIIFLIALGVFIYSGFQLGNIYYQRYKESEETKEIQSSTKKIDPDTGKSVFEVDWDYLTGINSDIVGYIYIPDTSINYPVVQGTDNTYYLTHTFEKQSLYMGAIFMDSVANSKFEDRNTIIYGHNVKHGTMFAELANYKDQAFWEEHPYIYLYTPDGNYRCDVLSMFQTTDTSPAYTTQFADDDSYMEYINMIREEAMYPRVVEMSASDRIMMFSTCSYENGGELSDLRYLVFAKLTPWEGVLEIED